MKAGERAGAAALRERRCEPCEGGVDPLDRTQAEDLMTSLHPDWHLANSGRSIVRNITFAGWRRAMAFANAVGWIADSEGHHPVLEVRYGGCTVTWTTHAIDGLSVNDFVCAAKVDHLVDDD